MYLSSEGLTPGMSYFDLLEPAEKVSYNLLLAAFRHRSASKLTTRLRFHQFNSIRRVMDAILLDHPELYYVRLWSYKIRNYHGLALFHFTFVHSRSECLEIDRSLSDSWDALKKKLDPKLTPTEQYQIIALEIASKVKYKKTGKLSDYTLAGPMLRQSAVCEGLAKLYCYYCRQAGLPVLCVSGIHHEPHSWNQIWLEDGTVRYLDITQIQLFPLFYRLFPNCMFLSEKKLRRRGYKQTPLKPDPQTEPIINAQGGEPHRSFCIQE